MGIGSHYKGCRLNRLLEGVAAVCDVLQGVSGGDVNIDPVMTLTRDPLYGLHPPGLWSPNRSCRLVETQDGWMAVNLPRNEDLASIPAWLGCGLDADPWQALVEMAIMYSTDALVKDAIDLHLPVAAVGEAVQLQNSALRHSASRNRSVIDLSALWAGPLCGGLLAEAGFDVTKIEDPRRPDPSPNSTPQLNQRINGRKRHLAMSLQDLKLIEMIANARILITSARPHALARAGLDEDRLFAINPDLLWIAITAHGWRGNAAMRVGFGDDCAAAGGLLDWKGRQPCFMGDALADPITGILAATKAFEAVTEDKAGLIDIALSSASATFAGMIK